MTQEKEKYADLFSILFVITFFYLLYSVYSHKMEKQQAKANETKLQRSNQ